MRDAVKKGNAEAHNLALLEDRIALRMGNKQIYGSQIIRDDSTGTFYVDLLEDPDNVDKRRASVGLQPLRDYARQWGIDWSIEQYTKNVKAVMQLQQRYKQD